MFFAQIVFAISISAKLVGVPNWIMTSSDVLETISLFATPLFLTANFCVIMTNQSKIKKMLLIYTAIALAIYVAIIFVFYRYFYGIMFALVEDAAQAYVVADALVKKVFGKIINYNVFADLALFSSFYLFLYYTPKKIKKKSSLKFLDVLQFCQLCL